ncbi:hypothetical protein AB1M95_06855 [Sulfitobacter sp. LCG007]
MNRTELDLIGASRLSSRRLSFNLVIRDTTVDVRACEVTSHHFRNRTSFPTLATLEDVIVEKIAAAIRSVISGLPATGAHVLSLPEFLVELPGLALSGVHVLITDVNNGSRNAIFRFKEFLGAVNLAFRPEIGFQQTVTDQNERLATHILADICLPILNLCRYNQWPDRSGRLDDMAKQLADKAEELEFQTELLKRFVYNSGEDHGAGRTGLAAQTVADHRQLLR